MRKLFVEFNCHDNFGNESVVTIDPRFILEFYKEVDEEGEYTIVITTSNVHAVRHSYKEVRETIFKVFEYGSVS